MYIKWLYVHVPGGWFIHIWHLQASTKGPNIAILYATSLFTTDQPVPKWVSQHKRLLSNPLWKHAYSNILKIITKKIENFQMKNSGSFHISAQNIDYGYSFERPRRDGSNEYQQSMVLSRNKKKCIPI